MAMLAAFRWHRHIDCARQSGQRRRDAGPATAAAANLRKAIALAGNIKGLSNRLGQAGGNNMSIKTKNTARADQYIDRIKNLPPAPAVATELLELFGDPNNNIDRVVELIRLDPSLTAKVLKRCNSSYFSSDQPCTDMFEIVTRLGFYDVYCMVATLIGASAMSLGKGKGGLDITGLWRHSVTTAVAAGVLAKHVEEPEAVAFTAGLLHDIGKLVFASVEGSRYARLVKRAGDFGTGLAEAEMAAFGVDHTTIGGQMLVRWGLPKNIAAAAHFHNYPPRFGKPHERLVAIVQIASNLARRMTAEEFQAPEVPLAHPEAVQLLELTAEDMPKLIAKTGEQLQRFEGLSTLSFDAAI
jgi:putative nucleotidyltransferase with HDIG domain